MAGPPKRRGGLQEQQGGLEGLIGDRGGDVGVHSGLFGCVLGFRVVSSGPGFMNHDASPRSPPYLCWLISAAVNACVNVNMSINMTMNMII